MKPKIDYLIKDAKKKNWVDDYAPSFMKPYLKLSRYDRPIGFWLLALPAISGLLFAFISLPLYSDRNGLIMQESGISWFILQLLPEALYGYKIIGLISVHTLLIIIGSFAMRGAGCTYNDLVDRKLDALVERTALRPLAAGIISVKSAIIWLGLQILVAGIIFLVLPRFAQIMALLALPLIALYPFMKRITWFPQVWLGITFNWGFLIYYTVFIHQLSYLPILFFFGLAFWTLGYDTIYAHQDKEDDVLIGIKSTARLFGKYSVYWLGLFYALSVLCIALSLIPIFLNYIQMQSIDFNSCFKIFNAMGVCSFFANHQMLISITLCILLVLPYSLSLIYQIYSIKLDDEKKCLTLFKLNKFSGILLNLALFIIMLMFYI